MSNLSELLPSGGGQNVVEFTASGAVSSGKPVILNSDGTVTEVSGTTVSQGAGSNATFESASINYTEVAYDTTNNKFVYIYSDLGNSSYGTAVVGTVSGTSISFGSPVVFESAAVRYTGVVYDSNSGKIVIVYQDQGNSEKGTAIVGTVSGTSISFGSAALFNDGVSTWISAAFDSTNNKVVVAYQDESNSNQGTGIVGTVSGTSISFGSEAIFNTGTSGSNYTSTTYDSGNGKIVVAFQDKSNSSYGTAAVGTVSGTSISWGSKVVYHNAGSCDETSIAYDSDSGKVIVACRYETNLDHGITYVGTVSGTSISFGSLDTFNSGTTNEMKLVYDPNAQLITALYRDGSSSSYLKANTGTVSGTSITWGTEFALKNYVATNIGAEYDPDSKQIGVGYRNNSIANYGYAVMYQNPYTSTNLTATNFIGLAADAISDGASGNINVKGGINEAQTGLTIGSEYYAQLDGTVSTTSTNPAVKIGQAISSNTINMRDLSYLSVEYLIVAGGGAGAQVWGGGGAGGLLTDTITTETTTYTIIVGAGGTGLPYTGNNQSGDTKAGNDSSALGITATGGGGGDSYTAVNPDVNGGSGGGGAYLGALSGAAGTGIAGQGNDGGTGSTSAANYGGGGGGGAGAVGGNGTSTTGGNGGVGLASSITGSSVYYAGGGGGGTYIGGTAGSGGNGGGGAGSDTGTDAAGIGTAGTANTGGGGGGAHSEGNTSSGANGGSGVVILRTLSTAIATTGSPTVTTDGSYNIYKFTGSGSITF